MARHTSHRDSTSSIRFLSSVNEAICHGIPDQRRLQEGDIINIGTFGPGGSVEITYIQVIRCHSLLRW